MPATREDLEHLFAKLVEVLDRRAAITLMELLAGCQRWSQAEEIRRIIAPTPSS
jgi:hypothetical protein